jgi:hypothetical protein
VRFPSPLPRQSTPDFRSGPFLKTSKIGKDMPEVLHSPEAMLHSVCQLMKFNDLRYLDQGHFQIAGVTVPEFFASRRWARRIF